MSAWMIFMSAMFNLKWMSWDNAKPNSFWMCQQISGIFFQHQIIVLPVLSHRRFQMASSNEELKNMLKETVKEILAEEKSKGYSSNDHPAAKSKSKPKKVTEFDETRTMYPAQESDPRQKKEQWPCYANHQLTVNNNRWGKWSECVVCGHRVSYTPSLGSPATSLKVDLSQNVTTALERLRMDGWTPQTLQPNTVKQMIKLVAAEHVTKNKPKLEKSKARAKKPAPEAVEELEVKSDDSFQMEPKDHKKK